MIVYSKDNCPHCVNAKTLLENESIEFQEIKIGRDITREEFLEMYPNVRSVPLIVSEEGIIGGFTDLKEFLKRN